MCVCSSTSSQMASLSTAGRIPGNFTAAFSSVVQAEPLMNAPFLTTTLGMCSPCHTRVSFGLTSEPGTGMIPVGKPLLFHPSHDAQHCGWSGAAQ